MLAITVTLLTAIYLLGPDLVSRFILGFVVPRRIIQQSKGEEVARAVLTAAIPLLLAVVWAISRHAVIWTDVKPDLKTVFSGLYSEKIFECDTDAFFRAAKTVWFVNLRIAWRLYTLLILYSVTVDVIIINYGSMRNSKLCKANWLKSGLAIFILPRVSEWHVMLTPFSHKKSTRITADILTKSDVLYRGTIEKPFLAPDGSLSGLLISEPYRYDRAKYVDDKKTSTTPIDKEAYWRRIPSNTFLMLSSEISTINLRRYDTTDPELDRLISQIFDEALTVHWASGQPGTDPADRPNTKNSG